MTTLESVLRTTATEKTSDVSPAGDLASDMIPEKILFWLKEQEENNGSTKFEWPGEENIDSGLLTTNLFERWAALSFTLEEAIIAGVGLAVVLGALLLTASFCIFFSRQNRRIGNFDVEIEMSERPTEEVAAPEAVPSEEDASSHIYEEIASSPERLI